MDHETIRARSWLQAYHDGELPPRQASQMEKHLSACAECCAELEALESLTFLLLEAPPAPSRLPEDRFVAQVNLRLVRRPAPSRSRRALEAGWKLIPAALVGVLLVFQATTIVTSSILVLQQMGIGGNLTASLLPSLPVSRSVVDILQAVVGSSSWEYGGMVLDVVPLQGLVGPASLLGVLVTLIIAVSLWSWLAMAWARQKHAAAPAASGR